jgi:hypothetical protein
MEQLQSHKGLTASSYMGIISVATSSMPFKTLSSIHVAGLGLAASRLEVKTSPSSAQVSPSLLILVLLARCTRWHWHRHLMSIIHHLVICYVFSTVVIKMCGGLSSCDAHHLTSMNLSKK